MKLETRRLILRQPKKSDWKDIVEGIGEYDVAKMLSKVPYPYKEKDAKGYITRATKKWQKIVKEDYSFFIELKSEKKVIGGIGINRINYFSQVGSTGAWINKKYWRHGYITEAKIALIDFAFKKLKLRKLESEVFTENKASNAMQIKMGYKLEGMKRKGIKSRATNRIHDENIYGLLKEDWQRTRKGLVKKQTK